MARNTYIIQETKENESIQSILKTLKKNFDKLSKTIEKRETKKNNSSDTSDKKKNNNNRTQYRTKKRAGGGQETYNFSDYQKSNQEVDASFAKTLINRINQDLLNVAATGRLVFPHHTDEGAQSQLRKILNGEKRLTKKVADKLTHLIDAGMIPTS